MVCDNISCEDYSAEYIGNCSEFAARGEDKCSKFVISRKLNAEIDRLTKEKEQSNEDRDRLCGRDGNATIQLSYQTDESPFERVDLSISDFGVSDNVYIVNSDFVNKLVSECANLKAETIEAEKAVADLMELNEKHDDLLTIADLVGFARGKLEGKADRDRLREALELFRDTFIVMKGDDSIGKMARLIVDKCNDTLK